MYIVQSIFYNRSYKTTKTSALIICCKVYNKQNFGILLKMYILQNITNIQIYI